MDPNVTKSPSDFQQWCFEVLGDRDFDVYQRQDHESLKRNLGFALYGEPNVEQDDNAVTDENVDTLFGYNKNQKEQIKKLYEMIKENNCAFDPDEIWIRIIFIYCTKKQSKKQSKEQSIHIEPVFVLKRCHHDPSNNVGSIDPCALVIDVEGRVYKSWLLYLNNNKLPKCTMFYPKNGHYTGEIKDKEIVKVLMEDKKSPAASITNKILQGGDITGTVASVGSTVAIVAAAAIPGIVIAPVALTVAAGVGVTAGAYCCVRSIAKLVDRGQHKQSIGLEDSEARSCWLNVGMNTISAVTMGASAGITQVSKRGIEIPKALQNTYNIMNGTLTATSLIGIVNSGYNIYDHYKKEKAFSPFEIFQMSSSILFFYLSVANFKTASQIISETQTNTLKTYETLLRSNRQKKIFHKAKLEANRLRGETAGNAETIRGIRNINDPDNFFAGLARTNKLMNKNNVRFIIREDGMAELNGSYGIDPSTLTSSTSTVKILESLPPFQRNTVATTITTNTTNTNNPFADLGNMVKNIATVLPDLMKIVRNVNFNYPSKSKESEIDEVKNLVKKLFVIVDEFREQSSEWLNKYKQLYPNISPIIGILVWLIKFAKPYQLENTNKSDLINKFKEMLNNNTLFIEQNYECYNDINTVTDILSIVIDMNFFNSKSNEIQNDSYLTKMLPEHVVIKLFKVADKVSEITSNLLNDYKQFYTDISPMICILEFVTKRLIHEMDASNESANTILDKHLNDIYFFKNCFENWLKVKIMSTEPSAINNIALNNVKEMEFFREWLNNISSEEEKNVTIQYKVSKAFQILYKLLSDFVSKKLSNVFDNVCREIINALDQYQKSCPEMKPFIIIIKYIISDIVDTPTIVKKILSFLTSFENYFKNKNEELRVIFTCSTCKGYYYDKEKQRANKRKEIMNS